MENTLRSKTLTVSLPGDPRTTFEWIVDSRNLSRWYGSLASSNIRFIREDRAGLLDLVLNSGAAEFMISVRVLANGDGSEMILTLIQPRALSDADFDEYIRGAESALAAIKAIQEGHPTKPVPVREAPAPQPVQSGKKLYVGNLPFSWAEDPLRELFAAHGTVATAVIARFRGRDNRSRGFGFVEMSTEAEALVAIEKLHETLAGERKIIVRLAKSQESHPENPQPNEAPQPARQAPQRSSRGRGGRAPRNKAPSRPPSRGPRPDNSRMDRPRRETGISNNSGYEIFPRNAKGGFDTEPTARSAASSTPPLIEPSPYMDDTGDIDNRGNNRPPRRRR